MGELYFDPVVSDIDWASLSLGDKPITSEELQTDIATDVGLGMANTETPSTPDTSASGWDISSLGYGDEQGTSVASMNGLLSAMGATGTEKSLGTQAKDFWDSIPKDLQKIAVMGAFSSMASIAKQNMADKQLKAIADEKQKDRDFKTSVAKYGSVKPQSMQTGLLASIQKRTPNATA